MNNKTEKIISPVNGYLAVLCILISLALSVYGAIMQNPVLAVSPIPVLLFLIKGLVVISPNSSKVLLLFGDYKGSVVVSGLFWINPFYSRTGLSLRARNFESEKIKVNDKMGNPI